MCVYRYKNNWDKSFVLQFQNTKKLCGMIERQKKKKKKKKKCIPDFELAAAECKPFCKKDRKNILELKLLFE